MLELLVRRQRPAERVAVEGPLDGDVERPVCMAPTISALSSTSASCELTLDVGVGPADLADHGADAGTRTSSKRTTAKRRVRSSAGSGVDA